MTDFTSLWQVGDILDQKDLCNLFLVADQRLSQAFITDMMSQGAIGAGEADEQKGRGERVMGEFLEQRVGDGLAPARVNDDRTWDADVDVDVNVEMRLPACNGPKMFGDRRNQRDREREQPRAGPAIEGFIQEALPELSRLSKALGRCLLLCVA